MHSVHGWLHFLAKLLAERPSGSHLACVSVPGKHASILLFRMLDSNILYLPFTFGLIHWVVENRVKGSTPKIFYRPCQAKHACYILVIGTTFTLKVNTIKIHVYQVFTCIQNYAHKKIEEKEVY